MKTNLSLTAKTEFNFDPGMSVNYVFACGQPPLDCLASYSGPRRYVDLGVCRGCS